MIEDALNKLCYEVVRTDDSELRKALEAFLELFYRMVNHVES
jgi:hypothetical protein